MSEETKQKQRDSRDILNLAASIGGPILVSGVILWVGWTLRAYVSIQIADQAKFNVENFVGKAQFKEYHTELSSKIDSEAQDINALKTGVAVINSKLDNVVHIK